MSYEWDFGDGETDTGTLTPIHAYADNGAYVVTLTVTDDDGGTSSTTSVTARAASARRVHRPSVLLPTRVIDHNLLTRQA